MSTIKAGHRITVVSWENDGDAYQTNIIEGAPFMQTEFIVEMLSHLESQSNGGKARGMWGNMYEPSEAELKEFGDFFFDIIKRHAPISYQAMQLDDEDVAAIADENLPYMIGEYLSEFTGYGEFFTRVVDSIVVEYIPTDITIENVTWKFVKND